MFIHVEYFYRIFMPSNLQMRYIVDSWVEFVSHRKAITTRESKETGHYICYKYVNGILLRFDDALVNRVDMLSQYHINLILYRCYDIDAYKWEIDLGFVAHLNQVTYGLRRPPIHGVRYSLCHKDITGNQHQANGSVSHENESNSNVVRSADEPLDMTKKDDLTSGQSVISHDVPVDMTVSRDKASANIPEDVSKSQEIDNELSVHIPECDVDTEKGQKEHADLVMDKDNHSKDTVDSTSNSQLEVSAEKDNNKSLGNISTEGSNSNENQIEDRVGNSHSEANSGDSSTQVDSQGRIQLSEFDETVDYDSEHISNDSPSNGSNKSNCNTSVDNGSKSVQNTSSNDSSSGSSGNECDMGEPDNKRPKPDLSLRPPLITTNTENTPKAKPKPKPRPIFPRRKPHRVQPSRAKKMTVQYIPYGSDSDSNPSDKDSKDEDFIPQGEEGLYNLYVNISKK